MDIEDAFSQEAIENANAGLDSQEEKKVRKVVRSLAQTTDEEWEHISVFAFMAGRTYESDQEAEIPPMPIMMDQATISSFIQFLVYRMEQI